MLQEIRVIRYPKYWVNQHGEQCFTRCRFEQNFNLSEFHCSECDDCKETLVAPLLLSVCERLRAAVGEPVKITSGYRCEAHNKRVGGAPLSYHTQGLAVDLRTVSREKMETLYLAAQNLDDIGAIGRYVDENDHLMRLHIDLRRVNKRVEWVKKIK